MNPMDALLWALLQHAGVSLYQGPTRGAAAHLGEGAVNRPHGRGGIVTTMEEYDNQRAEREHADYCDVNHCYCELPF